MASLLIYHLVTASFYYAQPFDQPYQPCSFSEEGFIHCTSGIDVLVEVANDYFSTLTDDLLALQIEPGRLTAPLKYEPPIAPASTGALPTAHQGRLFPHIYGPLNRDAIIGTFRLIRDSDGWWRIPS